MITVDYGLIFGIPGRIKIVSRDFLTSNSKLASTVIRNNHKNPKKTIFRSQKYMFKLETDVA